MKLFEVNRKVLEGAVKQAMGIQRKKKTCAFEEYLYLQTWDDKVTLIGTSLDAYSRVVALADIVNPASYSAFAVKAEQLHNIAKGGSADTMSFSEKNGGLYVTCGVLEQRLDTIDAQEFPELPIDIEFMNTQCQIGQADFYSMLKQVAGCMDVKGYSKRPMLEGISITANNNSLHMVALDGYELAEVNNQAITGGEFTTIVADHVVKYMLKTMTKKGKNLGKVEIACDEHWTGIRYNDCGTFVVARKVAGKYPDIVQYFPTYDRETIITADKKELKAIVDRAMALSDRKKSDVVLSLSKEGDTLTFAEHTHQTCKTYEVINLYKHKTITATGYDMSILLSAESLSILLRDANAKRVSLSFASITEGNFAPMVMTSADNDGSTYRSILMPVRVK